MSVAVQKNEPSWLEFNVFDSYGDPILLVEANQVRVFYKKHGQLTFTQKTPLITVEDPENPQEGENFVEIGFGVYAIQFSGEDLDTEETFTWVVIPDNPGSLDFKQFIQQIDVVPNTDVTNIVNTINTNVTALQTSVNTGFTATESDIAAIQAAITSLTATVNTMETTVNDISDNLPSSINVSFVN